MSFIVNAPIRSVVVDQVHAHGLAIDGDRWFTLAARQGKDGSSTEGQSEMLGGEGKYAGITGLCTYAVTALPDRWQTTTIMCDWIRE